MSPLSWLDKPIKIDMYSVYSYSFVEIPKLITLTRRPYHAKYPSNCSGFLRMITVPGHFFFLFADGFSASDNSPKRLKA